MSSFPQTEPRTKTSRILEYLISRGNYELSVEKISRDLEIDQKIVASIAGRLVARGIITRARRGVYVHEQRSVKASTIGNIFGRLETTMRKTFGEQILEKTGISQVKNKDRIEGLEDARQRTRTVLGSKGADNIFRLVIRKDANPSESKYILARLGISD